MASICLSVPSLSPSSKAILSTSAVYSSPSCSSSPMVQPFCIISFRSSIVMTPMVTRPRGVFGYRRKAQSQVVCMAPEEEKLTRRNPLDFPIEWERPKPGRRPDIFPQFSPMKTPLPLPLPYDPPEEDEEEEEKKDEEEEDPEKEEPEKPEKQQKHFVSGVWAFNLSILFSCALVQFGFH